MGSLRFPVISSLQEVLCIKEPQIACSPLSPFQGLCEIGVVISIFRDKKQRLGEVNRPGAKERIRCRAKGPLSSCNLCWSFLCVKR